MDRRIAGYVPAQAAELIADWVPVASRPAIRVLQFRSRWLIDFVIRRERQNHYSLILQEDPYGDC
jgi:hypothetical protein